MNIWKTFTILIIGSLFLGVIASGVFVKYHHDSYICHYAGFQIYLPRPTGDKTSLVRQRNENEVYQIKANASAIFEIELALQKNPTVLHYPLNRFKEKDFFQPLYSSLQKNHLLKIDTDMTKSAAYVRYKSDDWKLSADIILITPHACYLIANYPANS